MPLIADVNAQPRLTLKRRLMEIEPKFTQHDVDNMDDTQLRMNYMKKLQRQQKIHLANIAGANNAMSLRDFVAAIEVMNREGVGPKCFPVVKCCVKTVSGNHTVWRHDVRKRHAASSL